jgi:hypothetical protein
VNLAGFCFSEEVARRVVAAAGEAGSMFVPSLAAIRGVAQPGLTLAQKGRACQPGIVSGRADDAGRRWHRRLSMSYSVRAKV